MDTETQEIVDVLDRAIELMNESGAHWTQGSFRRPLGYDLHEYAYCSVGGIREAAGVRDPAWSDNDLSRAAIAAVARAYLPTQKERHDSEWDHGTTNIVIDWNDSGNTNWTKVVRRFKRARARVLARAKQGLTEAPPT